ncbi:biotin--[acetyl-CoA-carboxylase] ligase [Microlunatus panaciterrae]|nr:biotin--[acetyl-CoA-carboxylase] ligase [Microlunatus panaciterrae]
MLLTELLVKPGSLWRRVDVVASTGSTNADLAQKARHGAESGSVLVTGFQSAGRGRLGRSWVAPAESSIALSLLVRPDQVASWRWTWLPLLTGLAVVEGLRRAADVPAMLKWPNDVLVRERKLAGILAERVETPSGPACVVGIGLNVSLAEDELPVPTATSLQLAGAATTNRNTLIATILRAFALIYQQWESSDDDAAFGAAYIARCATIGRQVKVVLAADSEVTGTAEAIDGDGRLVVRTAAGRRTFGAADIVHLR